MSIVIRIMICCKVVSLPQGAEDLVGGRCFGEPLLEHVKRAGVGLVVVSLAGVGDDNGPVLQVACNARGGFDGDIGGDTDKHEGVDACHMQNGVECGAFEPVGRLSPDDWLIGPGGDLVDDLDCGSALKQAATVDDRAKHRGVPPNPGVPWLVCDHGVDHLCLGPAEPVQQPCLDPDDPFLLDAVPKNPVEGVVDLAGRPL